MEYSIKVLIVEDNWVLSEEIREVLQKENIEVVGQADNAQSAFEILEKEVIDLAIVDVTIEGKTDGIEFAHQINEIRRTPIIFLTAHEDQEIIERAKKVLPAAYMIKPLHPKNLLITIELIVDQRLQEASISSAAAAAATFAGVALTEDTGYFVSYPEDMQIFGLSFATNVGSMAL
ncbi:MAG: DUF1302 family protein, partial [Ekhidna sp.]|nr:DUF1302 family protein [Ekhidna sp.]